MTCFRSPIRVALTLTYLAIAPMVAHAQSPTLDFEQDLNCVPNTMTEAVGIDNADKINDALAEIGIGATGGNGPSSIGDGHGKFWAVAAEIHPTITNATNASPIVITAPGHGLVTNDKVGIRNVTGNTAANGVWFVTRIDDNTFSLHGSTGNGTYASGGEWWNCRIIRIPERSGGTLSGTGRHPWRVVTTDAGTHVVNSGSHEGRRIGGTTFVNTSDPEIIDTITVIGYFGVGWNIGPFCINGAYARTTDDANEAYQEDQMAAIGFENTMRAEGGTTGKVVLDLSYVNCQTAYRATEQPLYIGHGDNVVHLMFDCRYCKIGIGLDENQAVGNSVLFARFASKPIAFDLVGSGGNIHVSEAVLLEGGTFLKGTGMNSNSGRFQCDYLKVDGDDPATVVDLAGTQSHSIRINGQLGGNVITANANANQRFIKPCGRNVDIALDMWRLPSDESIAWSPKPYLANPTIFATPDLGLDEDYTPSTTDLQVYVDSTDLSTIPGAVDGLAVGTINSKFGAPNDFSTAVAGDKPTLLFDGIHRRPSMLIASDVLVGDATSVANGLEDFEVRAVVRPENHSGGSGENIIVGVWNQAGNERSWQVKTSNDYFVHARVSTDGAASTTISSDEPLIEGEPALIVFRRNATTGDLTLIVNGKSKTISGPTGSLHTSTADLTLGAGHGKGHTFEGDIQHVAVWSRLLATGAQSESEAHTRHWRRKAGVW